MFSKIAPVYDNEAIILFDDPSCVGNQALYMLITTKVDNFYRNMLCSFTNHGDQALQKLSTYCANITATDSSYYHNEFTTLCIADNESATHFLKTFVMARTKAEIAGNVDSDGTIVDYFLTSMEHASKTKNSCTRNIFHQARQK
jgi:hypothetical protein